MARKKSKKKPVRRHPAKTARPLSPHVPEIGMYTVLLDENRTFQMRIRMPTEEELLAADEEHEFPLAFEFVIHNDSVVNQVEFIVGVIDDEIDETGVLKFNVDVDDVVPHGDFELTQEQMSAIADSEVQTMIDYFFEDPQVYFDGKSTLVTQLTGVNIDTQMFEQVDDS